MKELCSGDAELYDVLGLYLCVDPIAAISKEDLGILTEGAEQSTKDKNYEEALQKYKLVLDKAIFEATQNPGERSRYIIVIQDLASKTAHVTEIAKEKVEKEGLTNYAASLERRIENYKFMSERIEDVIDVASHFYNERLEELGAIEGREARRGKRKEAEREEEREEKEGKERREARRKEMGREERKEAEREDKGMEKKEMERREARRKEGIEAETGEKRIELQEKEKREARRKERRETRIT